MNQNNAYLCKGGQKMQKNRFTKSYPKRKVGIKKKYKNKTITYDRK